MQDRAEGGGGYHKVSVKPQLTPCTAVKMRYAFKSTPNWGEVLGPYVLLYSETGCVLHEEAGMTLGEAIVFSPVNS